jgi:O-antigen/teichoic acid export membrane protein
MMRELIPFVLLAPLVAFAVWMHIWSRRKRRFYREHPERQPYGWGLLMRVTPFMAICGAAAIYGVVAGEASWAVLGVIGVGCFLWEIRRRWNPPS